MFTQNRIQCILIAFLSLFLLTTCLYIYLFSEHHRESANALPHHISLENDKVIVQIESDQAESGFRATHQNHLLTLLTYRKNHIQIPKQFQNLILLREICGESELSSGIDSCIDLSLGLESIYQIGTLFQQQSDSSRKDKTSSHLSSVLPTDYILFLDKGVQPKDAKFWPSVLQVLQTRFIDQQNTNIVGCKVVVSPDREIPLEKRDPNIAVSDEYAKISSTYDSHTPNTIQSAGYTAYFAQGNSAHLQPRYEGLSESYSPSQIEEWVLSVDRASVMIHKRLLHHLDHATFGDEYAIHDLCLSQRHVFYYPYVVVYKDTSLEDLSPLNKLPMVTPGSPVRINFPRFGYFLTPHSNAFYKKWTLQLRQHIGNHLKLPYKVAWDYGAGSCSGWFREATDFVTALEGSIPLRIITGVHDKCDGLPTSQNVALDRMISFEFDNVNIFISHKPPDRYPHFPYKGMFHIDGIPDYVVGRSMYEASLIPSEWVHPANTLVDEIWVPSKFLLKAFADAGVEPSRLVYIPEPIDIYFFDPRITKPMVLPSGTAPMESPITLPESLPSCSDPKTFKFLSIFKWEKRKGPDILFEAYFKAFKPTDRVCLYVSTYLYMGREPRNKRLINQEILRVARGLGLSVDQLPRYEILSDIIPTHEMPSLYMAADAFVLPTRGEGWGLPIMEAMTMNLPTIASRYGGQLDFMNDDNSYLIDVEMEDSDLHSAERNWWDAKSNTEQAKPRWAKPSVDHLVQLMHKVEQNRDEARMTGKRARKSISDNFSKPRVAAMVIARIQNIMNHLDTLQKRKRG